MHIGILTGGGDVPGLNACIRAVTLAADDLGWRVSGIRRGWKGLLGEPSTVSLTRETVRGIDRVGGTVLHTSRVDPRTDPAGDRTGEVLASIERLGLDALVALGGDGTLRFAAHLSGHGIRLIAVPKTMDNDVYGTDYAIGFSTAVTRSVEAVNRLRTTVASHERIGVVELFGRRSGETALLTGFLAQVDRTLISEVPIEPSRLIPLLQHDKATNPERYAILVVSEGATIAGAPAPGDIAKSHSARAQTGIARALGREIEARSGEGTVIQELAYIMRSGEPDALDRMVGFAFGAQAVQLLAEGRSGRMLALRDGTYTDVPADTLLGGTKAVDVAALYEPATYRAKLSRVGGMPMFLY